MNYKQTGLPLHDALGPLRDCVVAAQGDGVPVSSILDAVGIALADGLGLPTEQGRILALVALYEPGSPYGVPTAWIVRGLRLGSLASDSVRIHNDCLALARAGRLSRERHAAGWRIATNSAPLFDGSAP